MGGPNSIWLLLVIRRRGTRDAYADRRDHARTLWKCSHPQTRGVPKRYQPCQQAGLGLPASRRWVRGFCHSSHSFSGICYGNSSKSIHLYLLIFQWVNNSHVYTKLHGRLGYVFPDWAPTIVNTWILYYISLSEYMNHQPYKKNALLFIKSYYSILYSGKYMRYSTYVYLLKHLAFSGFLFANWIDIKKYYCNLDFHFFQYRVLVFLHMYISHMYWLFFEEYTHVSSSIFY